MRSIGRVESWRGRLGCHARRLGVCRLDLLLVGFGHRETCYTAIKGIEDVLIGEQAFQVRCRHWCASAVIGLLLRESHTPSKVLLRWHEDFLNVDKIRAATNDERILRFEMDDSLPLDDLILQSPQYGIESQYVGHRR